MFVTSVAWIPHVSGYNNPNIDRPVGRERWARYHLDHPRKSISNQIKSQRNSMTSMMLPGLQHHCCLATMISFVPWCWKRYRIIKRNDISMELGTRVKIQSTHQYKSVYIEIQSTQHISTYPRRSSDHLSVSDYRPPEVPTSRLMEGGWGLSGAWDHLTRRSHSPLVWRSI